MKRIYQPVKKKTILIVDDDQVAVRLYRETFQSQGFKVEVADNGHNAMQRLRKDPIDLVIFDSCLPGLSAIEFLEGMRAEFGTEALPLIAISNPYQGNLARTALESGETKCITKDNATPDRMLALVRELLGVAHSNVAGAAVAAVDSNEAERLAAHSETEFSALIASFLMNAPEALARLRASHQAFARAEQEALRRTELFEMHRHLRSLAGPAGLLGFPKIAHMATALEALLIELPAKATKITPSAVRTVAQAIDTLASLFDQAPDPRTEELAPRKVLVVDDEIISREIISSALGKAGLSVVSLDDSVAAQRLLEKDRFDLIFLDVEMPGQSGPDLCLNIREMAMNRATPVVFVTAHSDFGSRAQSTLSGGNDFIAKPFLLVELAVKALTWLFRKVSQAPSMVTPPDGASAEADSEPSRATPGPLTPHDFVAETLGIGISGSNLPARSFALHQSI
jgi:CheY-like chemotaxis protein